MAGMRAHHEPENRSDPSAQTPLANGPGRRANRRRACAEPAMRRASPKRGVRDRPVDQDRDGQAREAVQDQRADEVDGLTAAPHKLT